MNKGNIFIRLFKYIKHIFVREQVSETSPEWISQLCEKNYDQIPYVLQYKTPLIALEKVSGLSVTYAIRYKDHKHKKFCSYIYKPEGDSLVYTDEPIYTHILKQYKLVDAMVKSAKTYKADIVILHGIIYGPEIEENIYEQSSISFIVEDLILGDLYWTHEYDLAIVDPMGKYQRIGDSIQRRITPSEANSVLTKYNIPYIPIINTEVIMPDTFTELNKQLNHKSMINNKITCCGIIYRSETDPIFSFQNNTKRERDVKLK